MSRALNPALMAAIAVFAVVAPFLFPDYRAQIATLWVMVLLAQTWDVTGGQMGYNSFGNIVFFGIGVYVTALVQRDWGLEYFTGFGVGMIVSAAAAVVAAAILGSLILPMRGHYFAIATLGLGIAAGEIAGGWDFIGASSGMVPRAYPGHPSLENLFFSYLFFALAALAFLVLKWLYGTRFGLTINAIRDNEDKAEALGLRTGPIKTFAWCISAAFLALCGGAYGDFKNFIDPRDIAFPGPTFGVWMVLMAILGGKGTLWGPVLGAVIFHVTQEFFWTRFEGWHRVALGLLIVIIVVFFPLGILGWARERWPHRFGHKVETS